jgi:PAS domain S-box-containing protein
VKLSTHLTMAMVGLVLFTTAGTGVLVYRDVLGVAVPRSLERLEQHVRLVATELEAVIRAARANVLAIAMDEAAHVNSGVVTENERQRVASRFSAELTAQPWYDEIRIIDGSGRELIRVDHSGAPGVTRTVPEAELQREDEQDYFRKTIALPAGGTYVSPIELKQKHGIVEGPYIPIMRVATALFATDDRRIGIVAVDLDLRLVFADIRASVRQGSQIYLVNEAGDYLVHPDAHREFGFQLGSPARVQDDYPGLLRFLESNDAGSQVMSDRSGERLAVAWQTLQVNAGPRIATIETLPYAALIAGATIIRDSSAIAALAAVIVAFVLAVIIARSMTNPLVQMTRAVENLAHNEPIVVPTSASGEIGMLASAFARMDADVRSKTAALNREIEERRDSERMARTIIDTVLDAIIQVNESGEVLEWNPQAESILGWSRQEAMGRPITDLYLPKGYRPRYLRMNEGQVERVEGERFQIDAVRKDGQKIKVEISMTGVRRRGGNIYTLLLRDITAKIAAEEQMRQSQKMEAIGQLTGGIAHDFNNVLTAITSTIAILAEGVADRPQLAEGTKLIASAARRGAELTRRLLAFARKQPLEPRETDINGLIINAEKLFRPSLGEQIEVEATLDEHAWPALVDPTQLATALLNLAVNARDAMPKGGKLTFETRNVVLDESYSQANDEVTPGDYVMIAVSDTGTGIPAAIRDKIFDPFFSTKGVGKGTGLGLSMVYGFVKQSGGHVNVYSEEGHGTTIKLYLPRATAPEELSEAADPSLIEGGMETILVVEDDALVRKSVTTQIQSLGYQTIEAASGAEALAVVDRGESFDLLFTDVIMPSMNGRELAKEVVKRRPGMKVLFMSGYTEDAILHHGRLDPGVLLLAKPYNKAEIARMIRRALTMG